MFSLDVLHKTNKTVSCYQQYTCLFAPSKYTNIKIVSGKAHQVEESLKYVQTLI